MSTYPTIALPAKIKVKALGNRDVEIDKIEIRKITDDPYRKTVIATCNNHPMVIKLWEGAAYDAIGQWTDTDVVNRVLELYTAP